MKKLLILFFTAFVLTTQALPNDSLYKFSLKQSIEFALQNQKDVLNAELDADISHEQVKEYISIGLPQLSGSIDVKDYEKIPTQFFPDFISPAVYNVLFDENVIPRKELSDAKLFPVQFGTRWNATAGLTASQLLFDPSYLIGVKASRTLSELMHKSAQRTRIETAVNVSKAYYNVLTLNKRKSAVDANVQRVQKLQEDTKALYENGFVEKLDYNRVQVVYNNLLAEQSKFNRLQELALKLFQFQIGMPASNRVELTDSLNVSDLKSTVVPVEQADYTKRVEYSMLKTQEKLQNYNVRRYRSAKIPSLVAYGNLSTSAQRQTFNFFDRGEKWFPTGIIGATLRVPLFDGLQRIHKVREERLNLRKIGNELVNFEQAVNVDISSSRNALLDALNALDVQEKNLELSNDIYKTSKLKYEQGAGTNLEILNAETSLKESQANYYNSMFEAIVAKINLDKALGNMNY